jgi:hypothetical protein
MMIDFAPKSQALPVTGGPTVSETSRQAASHRIATARTPATGNFKWTDQALIAT